VEWNVDHGLLGFPFLHACERSAAATADGPLCTGASSSRLWVKYSCYSWRPILNWGLRFTFVSEVQLLQLTAYCEFVLSFVHGECNCYNRQLILNWDYQSEVQQLQLMADCELGLPVHVCEWIVIATIDSWLWTRISVSSHLWVKYDYNWSLIVNWDFHFFTFVSEVRLQPKTRCKLGFPFLYVCGWSTITTENSLWTGIFISSRLWVKYNYNWRLTVNWDFHFFTFVGEVQLQLKTLCELWFSFLHVCEWSTVTTEN